MMLIPRYTIKRLILITVVAAFFFLIVHHAVRGSLWAMAMAIGISSIFVAFSVFPLLFGLIWLVSLMTKKPQDTTAVQSIRETSAANAEVNIPD